MRLRPFCLLASLPFLLSPVYAELPKPGGVSNASPQDLVPGFIIRGNLGKGNSTHLLCVVQNINEWFDKYKTMAADELRGVAKSPSVWYTVSGYLSVDKDMEVVFEMGQEICDIGDKSYGSGTFRHTFKKGKYPFEVHGQHGKGETKFAITGAGGENVLFYTGEMLNKELSHGVKIEGKTYRSKMIGAEEPKK
jgi:hypothetical protein